MSVEKVIDKSKQSKQEKLIGRHPADHVFFSKCIACEDLPTISTKIHRKLTELDKHKIICNIDLIIDYIIRHHLSYDDIERKRKILKGMGLERCSEKDWNLPSSDKTQKANFAEILLSEYLTSCSNLPLLVYRLRYNPNIDQSMKGDDVLLIEVNDFKKIIIGEAKLRTNPDKSVIEEIIKGVDNKKGLPISLSFIANIVQNENKKLAENIERLNSAISTEKINIVNVGFLLGNLNASNCIELYDDSHIDNPYNYNLLFISLGIDHPENLVTESFKLAVKTLNNQENGK